MRPELADRRLSPRTAPRARSSPDDHRQRWYGVYSITLSNANSLIIEVAAYRPERALKTVAERRAAVLGWVLGSFSTPSLIHSALGDARRMSVTLYHANPGLRPEFIGQAGVSVGGGAFTHEVKMHRRTARGS